MRTKTAEKREGYPEPTGEYPSFELLMEWMDEGVCECTGECGCNVELDGWCPEGYPSWFLYLGLV